MKHLLESVLKEMETFLQNWTFYMKQAGYLEHTTAKREDCILSIQGVVLPIQEHLEKGTTLDFPSILKNYRDIAEFVLQTAKSHQSRGINAEMFFGCFKTLIHSVEDIILQMDLSDSHKLKGYIELRRIIDAMETIVISDWESQSHDENFTILAEKNRHLTLEKNKYENIFESTSDIVLVINEAGLILEMNSAARVHFGTEAPEGEILDLMGMRNYSVETFINDFPHGQIHEIRIPDGRAIYSMVIVPLKNVSLASAGHMIILSDITGLVNQRRELELVVSNRTVALRESEQLFRSLFNSAGEGILLVDKSLKIVQVNEKAADMFGMPAQHLEGVSCVRFIHPDSIDSLRLASSIQDGGIWHGEVNGITAVGDTFPSSITINKFRLGSEDFLHLIVRNITQQKAMEGYLRQEKTKAEEMNVTLRNVMKTIDNEKEELELSITQKVTTSIIPSLQKLSEEENSEIRDMYMNILRDQLAVLTKSSGSVSNEDKLRLTKSEIYICQMIQSGDTSKDIAEALHISIETVQTHRKNIRRKLGLCGKDVNLFAYLNR